MKGRNCRLAQTVQCYALAPKVWQNTWRSKAECGGVSFRRIKDRIRANFVAQGSCKARHEVDRQAATTSLTTAAIW